MNAKNGNHFEKKRCRSSRSRLTRWTGYEVFVKDDLTVWIVFDKRSSENDAKPWYPVVCGLTNPSERGIAQFLPSLSELEHVTFEIAKKSKMTTHKGGDWRIDRVEESEVKKRAMKQFKMKKLEMEKLDLEKPQ